MAFINKQKIEYVIKLIKENNDNEYCGNVQNNPIYKDVMNQLFTILYL